MKNVVTNLRNGLKWRGGRPRWEPSPNMRKAGIRGRDLKDLHGQWITDRGTAITLCDDRLEWSRQIRAALEPGAQGIDAHKRLNAVLDLLTPPRDEAARLRRHNVADLIEKARALCENRTETPISTKGPTIADLVAEYFAMPPKDVTASSLRIYEIQSKKILARWQNESIHALTVGRLYSWYQDELLEDYSNATANQIVGTLGSFYKWAIRRDWIRDGDNPVRKLGQQKADGRLVFITFELEKAAVAWCDANGYADVADMIVAGCWIGARQIDMCAATLGDLSGDTWLYTPIKTQRKGGQAMPGILPPVKARVERRRQTLSQDGVTYMKPDLAPFLFNPASGQPHTSDTIGDRFARARLGMLRAHANGAKDLAGIGEICLRDTRDTCVTRIFYSQNMEIGAICPWTGHSQKSAERILRHHYIVLQRSGALATGDRLLTYARAQGWNSGWN